MMDLVSIVNAQFFDNITLLTFTRSEDRAPFSSSSKSAPKVIGQRRCLSTHGAKPNQKPQAQPPHAHDVKLENVDDK